jgi:hypothetical protein
MSLPACQQRVLDTIESALQKREPRLTSMFAIFTRLNTHEAIPRTERLEARLWWAWCRWRQHRSGTSPHARGTRGRSVAAARAMLLIPLAVMLVASVIFLSINSPRLPCTPTSASHGMVTSQNHSKNCAPTSGSRYFGHGP